MKKYVLLFWVTVFLSPFFWIRVSVGQNPLVKQWDYRYGGTKADFLENFQITSDSGFILGGYSVSGSGGNKSQNTQGSGDYWIVKTDSSGNIMWDKDFGGNGLDVLRTIDQTQDGGYILSGLTKSGIGGDKTQANYDTIGWTTYDIWLVRVNSNGNFLWDRTLGTDTDDLVSVVMPTNDGGFLVGGASRGGISYDKTQLSQGNYDFWIIKLDSLGNKQWDKAFGGAESDFLAGMVKTNDGGYLLGGQSLSDISGDKTQALWGEDDLWIVKIDSAGNKLWDKSFGGTQLDDFRSIQPTSDNGFIIGGKSMSGIGGNKSQASKDTSLLYQYKGDYWILKLDSSGNLIWDKSYGGFDADALMRIEVQPDKGYLLSGISRSQMSVDKTENNLGNWETWFLKIDSLGIKKWDRTVLTNSTVTYSKGLAVRTADECYLIATHVNAIDGGDVSQPGWGGMDYWIIKFCDTTLTSRFASSDTTFCDKQYIDFYDLSTNNPTSWQWLFPGGSPSSSTLQNPVGIYYNSYGSFDVTLIACNASGCDTLFLPNFIHEFQSPPVPLVTWSADTLYSTPAFSYQWYFNSTLIPGATGQYYVFQQPGNYFVIVTDSNGCATSSNVLYTGIEEANTNMGIYVIPNPTQGDFILFGAPVKSLVKIYDVTGRIVFTEITKTSSQPLHVEAGDGIYFIEISDNKTLLRQKIIIKN